MIVQPQSVLTPITDRRWQERGANCGKGHEKIGAHRSGDHHRQHDLNAKKELSRQPDRSAIHADERTGDHRPHQQARGNPIISRTPAKMAESRASRHHCQTADRRPSPPFLGSIGVEGCSGFKVILRRAARLPAHCMQRTVGSRIGRPNSRCSAKNCATARFAGSWAQSR